MDYGLEPLQRARSNTWPLPRPDAEDGVPQIPDGGPSQLLDIVGGGSGVGNGAIGGGPSSSSSSSGNCSGLHPPQQQGLVTGPAKKTTSRRNAWGNQSYADLITQAISSVPEQRLTLSQIYEWMVQNVPYFKDKGDSNSSAGWKVRLLFFLPIILIVFCRYYCITKTCHNVLIIDSMPGFMHYQLLGTQYFFITRNVLGFSVLPSERLNIFKVYSFTKQKSE